jgi:short-subunit dehydrogenase
MKNALLTGASSGIGLETARLLCNHGYNVWGTSRDPKQLPTLPNFHPLQVDLTSPDCGRQVVSNLLRDIDGIEVLINNAGTAHFGPTESGTTDFDRELFQLLVHSPVELIRLVLPSMRQRKCGLIINVTSLAVLFPIPMMVSYSAAKAALSNFTAGLHLELRGTGIRVVDLQPGDIRTHFNEHMRHPPLPPDSPYRESSGRILDNILEDHRSAPPPELVAKVIWQIIQMPNPPPVVPVGSFLQAGLGPLGKRWLPSRLMNWILAKRYGL